MQAQHARPVHHVRDATGVRGGLLKARFGMLALVPAAMVGLGSGAVVGTTVLGADPVGSAEDAAAVSLTPLAGTGSADGARAEANPPAVESTPSGAADVTAGDVTATTQVVPLDDLVPELDPERVSAVPDDVSVEDVMAGLLTTQTPTSADGELVVVPGSSPAPDPAAPVRVVRVEVEAGLPVDGEKFATLVMGILNNPQGWGHDGQLSFARTDGDDQDIRVVLASPDKVDELCAPLTTDGTYSCGRYGHAAINYTRWVAGAGDFTSMTQYRQYVINHEVGHLLGHPHVDCPGAGETAPIMQQQSVSVLPCIANGWPYPDQT
ncbi:DUF3152 domain-containing protein [Actinotalea sp. M2MS4P-6]|uniref:DUF3152 domain-containing protein n=1 Tax=Actinotalea sp. M2MS4P-6 TaxID=2983762 RepID=UPI0021E39413|nr:DUF3152 domain-containing protein [Actinotalea sp. M2MS4P-6]MCV2396534.1 DUF3152 domain-containing protein [Actinotalea sp. M2MS4P-6]